VRSIGRLRPAVGTLAGVLGLAALAAGCARPPRSDETDGIAKVVADAISYPRQDSAAGYARAALATRAGQDGRLRVVAIEELRADQAQDPMARLVFLVHLDAEESAWTTIPAVTTCYEARFNYYGVIGSPRRIACPKDPTPITPPTEPGPRVVIPDGADELVQRVLAGAPRGEPRAEEVSAALLEGLRKAAAGAAGGPKGVPPPQVVSTAPTSGSRCSSRTAGDACSAPASAARSWCGGPAGSRCSPGS
jgi:hypothetical protein